MNDDNDFESTRQHTALTQHYLDWSGLDCSQFSLVKFYESMFYTIVYATNCDKVLTQRLTKMKEKQTEQKRSQQHFIFILFTLSGTIVCLL